MRRDKTKIAFALSIVLALVLGIGIGGYAASGYGSESDPLVTLSYLTDKLTPQIMEKVEQQIDVKLAAGSGTSTAENYRLVTLTSGQKLIGEVGCEILLRIGTASCVAEYTPGLVDLSSSSTINSGAALTANHLYIVTIEDHGITATAQTVKVLVRGSYTIA